jgi:hypothetical protein
MPTLKVIHPENFRGQVAQKPTVRAKTCRQRMPSPTLKNNKNDG